MNFNGHLSKHGIHTLISKNNHSYQPFLQILMIDNQEKNGKNWSK